MNEIEIRARLAQINAEYYGPNPPRAGLVSELGSIYDQCPIVVDKALWEAVVQDVSDWCAEGGGCDGRPGRLFAMSDEDIVAAQDWIREHGFEKLVASELVSDQTEDGTVVLKSLFDGTKVTEDGEQFTVPSVAYQYVCKAFSA
jgi:hypothetical protein